MMDFATLPLTAAIALVSALLTAGGVFAVMRHRIEVAEKSVKDLREAHEKAIADARGLAVKALGDLADFKVEAARQFVTDEMLMKVEERIVAAVDRLADRLDRLLDGPRSRGGPK